MPNGVTVAKKSPKTQRSGGVQGGARGGMGGGTDRVSACAWSRPRARPRKRRSGRKVGQDARARGGDQVKWGRAGVISTIDPIFGVFSLLTAPHRAEGLGSYRKIVEIKKKSMISGLNILLFLEFVLACPFMFRQ